MPATTNPSRPCASVSQASRILDLELAIWHVDEDDSSSVAARPESQIDQTALTVLVADDDPDMRAYLTRCLRRDPVVPVKRVVEVGDGVAALSAVRQGGIDVIISDINMPGLDGLALCRALLAEEACGAVPVLLITGQALPAHRPANARFVLAKPFNARALREHLMRLLPDGLERAPP